MPTAGEPLPEAPVTPASQEQAAKVQLTEQALEGLKAAEGAILGAIEQPKTDMLAELFRLQEGLNNKVFAKQGIGFPNTLTMAKIKLAVEAGELGPNGLPNQWMRNYLRALQKECGELDEKLLWKWWSKDQVDLQQVRVEIIDQLHFWISLAQASGMTAEDVFRVYTAKHQVNEKRQNEGYSAATKKPDDTHIK